MTAVHPYLMNLYVRVACKEIDLSEWLTQTGTYQETIELSSNSV